MPRLCHIYKLYERPILNRIIPTVESHLITEQAGFRPGKSCTSQPLNLTQHIEDGYPNGMITGAAFAENERSRWRKQKNGLPQGNVISPVQFNIYTNDQPIYTGTLCHSPVSILHGGRTDYRRCTGGNHTILQI